MPTSSESSENEKNEVYNPYLTANSMYGAHHGFNSGYFNPLDTSLQAAKRTSWVGGPTHNVQDQHIPGYIGHVHSMYAENLHGKSFAKLTADS